LDENDIKNSEEKKNEHVEVDDENSITNSVVNQLSDNFMTNDSSNENECQSKTLHTPGKLKFFFFAQP